VNGEALWPGGARGALNLTFDNLGEAAELEMGALPADAPLGRHVTATEVTPALLDRLAERGLSATFFVEGLNTELYPKLLQTIDAAGHEVAYHAWRHEEWTSLSPAEQADNLARGLAGFEGLGLQVAGLRPPGGGLGAGGVDVLREAGLRYGSPAGRGAGEAGGVALLPFQWRHVDAACVLPPLGPVREQMTGSSDPLDPGAFVTFLEDEVKALAQDGGYMAIILHPFMFDWLGKDRLDSLLDLVAGASQRDELWVARCADTADHVLTQPAPFQSSTALDSTSWSG
jgi:peptidoglycan/xylan/chitin deacetylase (PgdA/CDA1 family)